ncbi:hypothetical protein EC912_101574 [Luteibacter rhizovicinus]|uniref:Uncharacterized protein n=1 Tax=Luteibacter rhizovicinus TaxID=242606 RepID=A0A4R3YWP6_9GAMM|nr:folate-binding protein YgfZ [Luteibacter rhizovicinus]TCV97557.1 hypothetical protein EC912_101574 [Luteibacter rhizovicinus]
MPPVSAQTLTLEGPDAIAFAQAQFSSDVAALAEGHWQWSGWLDAQGRIRSFVQIARTGHDRLLVLLRGGNASALADGLRRFVFRSKVVMHIDDTSVIADDHALDAHTIDIAADKNIRIGMGDYSLRIGDARHGDTHEWRAHDIARGYPWLPDAALDRLLAPAISMERLHAVAFDKGCYPGQEIVARLHYRGGHKRHMHCVESSQALNAGDTLRIEDREGGVVLSCVHSANGMYRALVVLDDGLTADGRVEFGDTSLHIVQSFST